MGGRWTVDNNLEWIKEKFPEVDFICKGCPDMYIEELLDDSNWSKYTEAGVAEAVFERFNYKILFEYQKYQPSIEISRGCGNGCAFCLEGKQKPTKAKAALEVLEEAAHICKIYEDDKLNFYFQASMFNPTKEWAETFREKYKKCRMQFNWRFETRVDLIKPEVLEILAEAGLKVIDLGLESASIKQLEYMEKTKNPKEYLRKAEVLLAKAYECGVWCKLNILLYAGETEETIEETLDWLKKEKYKGVSVNPLILYLNGEFTEEFISKIKEISKCNIDIEGLYQNGYTFIDLSPEITREKAEEKSRMIAEECMTKEDYIALKEICYMPRKTQKDLYL